MYVKKTPIRTCVVTKEKCDKRDLVRIVRTPEGNVEIDLSGKKNGRGAYLKKDKEVFAKAQASKILDKILGLEIKDEVFQELNKLL